MKALNLVLVAILLLAVIGIVYHVATTPPPQGPEMYKYPGIIQKFYGGSGYIAHSCAGTYNNGTCAYYTYYVTMSLKYLVRYNGTSLNQLGNYTYTLYAQATGAIPFVFPPFYTNSTVWAYVKSGQIQALDYRSMP